MIRGTCIHAIENEGRFSKIYTKNVRIGIESRLLSNPSHSSRQRHEGREFVVKKKILLCGGDPDFYVHSPRG